MTKQQKTRIENILNDYESEIAWSESCANRARANGDNIRADKNTQRANMYFDRLHGALNILREIDVIALHGDDGKYHI